MSTVTCSHDELRDLLTRHINNTLSLVEVGDCLLQLGGIIQQPGFCLTQCIVQLELELELEFYLFDRQLHNVGEIISKKMCEIILSGDSHKGTNWPLA